MMLMCSISQKKTPHNGVSGAKNLTKTQQQSVRALNADGVMCWWPLCKQVPLWLSVFVSENHGFSTDFTFHVANSSAKSMELWIKNDKNLPFQTSSSLFRWVHFHPNMSQLRPPSEHLHACLGSQPTFGRKMTNAILKPLNLFACLLRQKKDGTKWETDCKPLCSFSRFSCWSWHCTISFVCCLVPCQVEFKAKTHKSLIAQCLTLGFERGKIS